MRHCKTPLKAGCKTITCLLKEDLSCLPFNPGTLVIFRREDETYIFIFMKGACQREVLRSLFHLQLFASVAKKSISVCSLRSGDDSASQVVRENIIQLGDESLNASLSAASTALKCKRPPDCFRSRLYGCYSVADL